MKNLFIISCLFLPYFLTAQKVSKKQVKKAKKYFEKFIVLAEENEFDDALLELENAINSNPNKVEYHLAKVDVLFSKKEIQQAIGYLNRTVDLFPEESTVYNARAVMMDGVRYFEFAIKDFTKAIAYAKNKKERAVYYSNRGGSKSQIMDYHGAYEDLMKAYELDMNNKDVLNNLATLCDEVGKPDETLMYLNKIIELDSTYIPAYVNIGFKYQLMGNHEKAIKCFSKVLELNPGEALAYSNISYSFMKIGKLKEALENINQSIELNSLNPYAYRNRALIYLEKKEIAKACEDINSGLKKGFTKSFGNELNELKNKYCKGVQN